LRPGVLAPWELTKKVNNLLGDPPIYKKNKLKKVK
jgi:hypothetical protein